MEKNKYLGNYIKFLINGGFIGIGGMPIGSLLAYYSVMTVFMTSLGYSSIAYAVVNAIFYLGFALPQIPSAYFLESKTIKKRWMGILQLLASSCFLLFGVIMLLIGDSSTVFILCLFILFYSLGCTIGGSAIPTQFALFNKIVPPEKIGSFMGIMFVMNSLAGMAGGGIVTKVMGLWPVDRADPAFSLTAFKFLFILAFFFVLFAVIVLWSIKEKEGEKIPKKENFLSYVKDTMGILKKDTNLVKFFVGKNLMFGQYATKLFYATYAITHLDVASKYAGLFISFFLGGFFVAGLTLAKLADRYGPKFLLVLSQVLALAGLLCALFARSVVVFVDPFFSACCGVLSTILGPVGIELTLQPGYQNVFFLVFFFAGLSAICDNVGYSNMAFLSCPIEDKTTYIGLVNLFTFLLPVVMPFVFGGLESTGIISIGTVFIINCFVMIAAILWLLYMVDNPEGFKKLKKE